MGDDSAAPLLRAILERQDRAYAMLELILTRLPNRAQSLVLPAHDMDLLERLVPALVGALGDCEFLTADLYDEIGPRVVLRDCGRSRRSVGKLLARAADKRVPIAGFLVVKAAQGPPPQWRVTAACF
ncbi:MAG: hypothetical protein ACR2HE_10860 [Casimicrobiaceae bacterium]